MAEKNEALLKEIRENFQYCVDSWREIREEAGKDMKVLAGDPWDPKEKKAREDAGRPALVLDEIDQYVNQIVNDIRVNKRAIKITPEGDGASEKHGELRQNRIRQIEYKSTAQTVYTTAYQDAVERSYGAARVSKQYVDDSGFDQELVIKRIPNPDSVYIDPDCKEADCSDMRFAFVIDRLPRKQFQRQWTNAEIKDFGSQHFEIAGDHWLSEEHVQIAEYWKVKITPRTLLLVDDPQAGPTPIWKDMLPKEGQWVILKERKVEQRQVVQYITNGVEILEENEWEGKWIPIVPLFGKERYIDKGSGSKRMLFSAVRKARDPFMLYCYYRTCQAEFAGMIPKVPAVGYKGQFEGEEDNWNTAHKVPRGFLEVHARTDATGDETLPIPTAKQWDATPLAMMDQAAESARRAIQAAMGQTSLPTAAQRQNEKSGIALQRIESQMSRGSYHFIDNFDRFLAHIGRILDDMLDKIEDTPRDIGIRKPDDSYEVLRLKEPRMGPDGRPMMGPDGQPDIPEYGEGRYNVTVSTGPSFESQREEAGEFATELANNPQVFPIIADLVIKLKNLGPIGDQIAERLTPPQFAAKDGDKPLPPQHAQQMMQMQQYIQQLEQMVQQLQQEQAAKKLELESKERIAALEAEVDKMKIEADATKALAQLQSNEAIELLKAEIQRIGMMISQMMQPAEREPEGQPATV